MESKEKVLNEKIKTISQVQENVENKQVQEDKKTV